MRINLFRITEIRLDTNNISNIIILSSSSINMIFNIGVKKMAPKTKRRFDRFPSKINSHLSPKYFGSPHVVTNFQFILNVERDEKGIFFKYSSIFRQYFQISVDKFTYLHDLVKDLINKNKTLSFEKLLHLGKELSIMCTLSGEYYQTSKGRNKIT